MRLTSIRGMNGRYGGMNGPSPDGRTQAVEAIGELRRAMQTLEDALHASVAAAAGLESGLAGSLPAIEVINGVQMADLRTGLTARTHEFDVARKAARQAIIAVLISEGATLKDVARIFGVSRQLASRLAHGLPAKPVDAI